MSDMWATFYHWRTWLTGVFCLGLAFDNTEIPKYWFPSPWFTIWGIGVIVATILFVFVIISTIKHNNVTCPTCMMEIPSDAAWQAKVKDNQLRYYHWETGGFLQSSVIILSPMILAAAISIGFAGTWIAYIGSLIMVGWWLQRWYAHRAIDTHEILKSFCPYCKGGNDDDRSPEIVPDPTGSKTG